jgi:hypothetical protein
MAAFVCVSMFLVNILSVDISMYESCKNFLENMRMGVYLRQQLTMAKMIGCLCLLCECPMRRWYSFRFGKRSCLQRYSLQNTNLIYFYIKIFIKNHICIFLWKCFFKQIYWYDFYIYKLNNLKVIHHLYSQYLTETVSKRLLLYQT